MCVCVCARARVCVLRQGFSVALKLVLELALVDQAGLELRDSPASASRVLGLKRAPPLSGFNSSFMPSLP